MLKFARTLGDRAGLVAHPAIVGDFGVQVTDRSHRARGHVGGDDVVLQHILRTGVARWTVIRHRQRNCNQHITFR